MIIPAPEFDRLGLVRDLDEHAKPTGNPAEEGLLDRHNPPIGASLLESLAPEISRRVGAAVFPRNCYGRIATAGARLTEHVDRPGIDLVLSVNVLRDAAWYFEVYQGGEWKAYNDAHGAILLRSIDGLPHRREPYAGERAYQLILNYTLTPPPQVPPQFEVIRDLLSGVDIGLIGRPVTETAQLAGGRVDTGKRVSRTAFLDDRDRWGWLFEKIEAAARAQNEVWPRRDIGGGIGSLQYTEYAEGGHYGWHTDRGDEKTNEAIRRRTVSMSILLEGALAGGGIELRNGGRPHLGSGDAILFPADEEHRALPVEAGERRVLVVWLQQAGAP